MGDFEDIFGAGADIEAIIDGLTSDEENVAASHRNGHNAWMASMKAKGYVRGPHFDSFQQLAGWDRLNSRPHIRRPTYYGYDVFFTDGRPYTEAGSTRQTDQRGASSENDDEIPF